MTITAERSEKRIPAPELRGAALALGSCRDLEVCLDGPAGCVAGETRIYNPVTGSHTPIKELCEKKIAPIVQTLMGAMQAEIPFRKGIRKLYRVTLSSGRHCVVTGNHLFLTPDGWRFASSCEVGSRLLVSSPCPLQSTGGPGPSVSLQDALRLSQTPLGSQEYYSVYSHPCDGQPQSAEGNAQVVAPSQDGALSHSRVGLYEDDQDSLREYIRRSQQYGHLARSSYSPLFGDRADALCYALQGTSLQADVSSRCVSPSPREKSPLLPTAQSQLDGDNTLLHEPSLVARLAVGEVRLRDVWECLTHQQLALYSVSSGMTQEYAGIPPQLRACNLSFDTSNAINSSINYDYTIQWDTVSSIEYLRTDEYFDVHVPVAGHYLAEGIWHHNTGKTYAALYKVHMMLLMYPGSKALVARKSNTALAGSAMATFREMLDPDEGVTYFGGNKVRPAAFEYPNGSIMVMSGLDKREKIKSYEFDIAYLNEATELEEEDVDYVRSRLRHGKMPYHQIILDCNPDAPEHWLNLRMNSGKTTRLLSRHEDNPRYWSREKEDWTDEGREYIFVVLGGLTGVLLERMRWGVWAAAFGTIYQGVWDRKRNVIEPYPIPKEWPRYLVLDFGFSNPFVCKWYAMDPDGRLICYREIYMTKRLVEDHCKDIVIVSGWFHLLPKTHEKYQERPAAWADPLPREVIADHDAEDRETFTRHTGFYTTPAHKSVSDGIQAVAVRLRPAGDGKPRLLYFKNCLVKRDEDLAKRKRPTCSIEEFNVYVWAKKADQSEKEEPLKENDHGMDCDRYCVSRFDVKPGNVTYHPNIWR